MSKVCTVCLQELAIECFWFNTKRVRYHSNCKKCKYEKSKKYNNVSKEQKAKYDATYRAKHAESLKISKKNEYERNKDKYISRALVQQRTPEGRLKHNIRTRIGNAIKAKSNSSKDLLGCDIETYISYLEFQFEEKMSWENYGDYWQIDHVNPICNFDLSKEEELLAAFNWKNTRPLSSYENLSRSKYTNIDDIEQHKNAIKNFKCDTVKLRELP